MISLKAEMPNTFKVDVVTTSHRGFTPEEVAQRCSDKIIQVSDSAPPVIRDQAQTFKVDVTKIIAFYMHEAVKSDRTTIYNALIDAGHPKLAEMIRRL
ncbi:MAG: hypothetical protein CML17_07045 [Pusillimonas sp.]|jgi:adenylyl- and sulfurtransferase ThiI|nr:hypothetical protein [Pusillimonas sp.]|tara:strand:- start:399 stop:692 length:294 start_codon:yes stop_codon:yes gene_type:complete